MPAQLLMSMLHQNMVRNSISNDKLQSVAILAIERERAQLLDTDAVIAAFAAGHRNRRIALVYTRAHLPLS